MEKLDSALQNAKMLQTTCNRHAASGDTDGISADQIQLLAGQIANASSKDTQQKRSIEVVSTLTARQNEMVDKGDKLIQKVKEAAKGKYGEEDKARMREFHVGRDVPRSVKGLVSELKYTREVALANKSDLAQHGLKETQIEMLGTTADELSTIDAEQETAKKKQKAATNDRDNAMEALRKAMRKIQHSARSIFADEPSVLIEFESIARGRGPGGQNSTPPPPEQPTQ